MEAPAPVFTWFGLILIACFIAGVLVAGGVLVAVVFATRPRKRPRPVVARSVREAPRPAPPLPAFRWPDDEKSRHGQRVLAVLLSLLIAAGLVVILGGVLPKAGLGFNAVMLYVIALVSVVPVIMSLLRWGFRRTPEPAEAPRPVAVPAPDAGPTSPGLSPAMKRFIAGLVPSILFLGVVGSMLVYSFDARHARGGRWELGAIVGFAAGIVLTVIVQRRLSRWAFSELLDPDRARPEAKAAVRRPGARPTAAPTVPIPWSLGWMVGPPILVFVVLGVAITTAYGGRVGVQRVDILLVGGMVAFGALMLVRLLRQPAPGATPAAPAPVVEAPAVPLIATPAAPRACPKCGRAIAAGAPEGLCPRCLIGDLLPEEPRHSPTTAYGPFVPPAVEEVATFFPHLEVIRLIGQGGMGAVYLARQKGLDRLVALKLINARDDDPTFAERFAREAKAMGKLSHPNVVTIHDHGTADGLPFLVMEYVDGVTLRDTMRAKTLTPTEALKIIPQVCDALEYAHAQGVVHRDVKPENILLDKSGMVKIADFGLAKLVDPDGLSLTHTRQAMGTPHYMAPEQWERPTEVDHRADIYALGVLLYELLTGELPLGRFDPPSVKARVDARIDELVLRALAKEPGRRYQHASDVKAALANIDRGGGAGCRWHGVGPNGQAYSEYKSATTFLGWPLVHVAKGPDPITGMPRVAQGWLAIGDGGAIGGVAIGGGFSFGLLALGGGFSLGLLSIGGGLALGVISLGGVAGGLLMAFGGAAASGGLAVGGAALGRFAIGGAATGQHVIAGTRNDRDFWEALSEWIAGWWPPF